MRRQGPEFISEQDKEALFDLIGEVYFKPHGGPNDDDFKNIHKKLADFRNELSLKYNYDRNDYGVDIDSGKIVRLWPFK